MADFFFPRHFFLSLWQNVSCLTADPEMCCCSIKLGPWPTHKCIVFQFKANGKGGMAARAWNSSVKWIRGSFFSIGFGFSLLRPGDLFYLAISAAICLKMFLIFVEHSRSFQIFFKNGPPVFLPYIINSFLIHFILQGNFWPPNKLFYINK